MDLREDREGYSYHGNSLLKGKNRGSSQCPQSLHLLLHLHAHLEDGTVKFCSQLSTPTPQDQHQDPPLLICCPKLTSHEPFSCVFQRHRRFGSHGLPDTAIPTDVLGKLVAGASRSIKFLNPDSHATWRKLLVRSWPSSTSRPCPVCLLGNRRKREAEQSPPVH